MRSWAEKSSLGMNYYSSCILTLACRGWITWSIQCKAEWWWHVWSLILGAELRRRCDLVWIWLKRWHWTLNWITWTLVVVTSIATSTLLKWPYSVSTVVVTKWIMRLSATSGAKMFQRPTWDNSWINEYKMHTSFVHLTLYHHPLIKIYFASRGLSCLCSGEPIVRFTCSV